MWWERPRSEGPRSTRRSWRFGTRRGGRSPAAGRRRRRAARERLPERAVPRVAGIPRLTPSGGHATLLPPALPAQRTKEVLRASSSPVRRGEPRCALPDEPRLGVVVAGRRRRASSVHARRRRLCGGPAPRDRRFRGRRVHGSRTGVRHGELRRLAPDLRARRYDPDVRRVRGDAGSSRLARRRQGRLGRRGVVGRDHGLER